LKKIIDFFSIFKYYEKKGIFMETEHIGRRLETLIEVLEMKGGDFAKKAEISQSLISNIIAGKNGPSKATVNLICRTYNVNKEWLLTGRGEMFILPDGRLEKLSPDERELLEIYDKLIPETQKEVRDYANEKLELQELRGNQKQTPGGTTRPLEAPQAAKSKTIPGEKGERRADTSEKPV
jgi:transcriptional regulator with XRE-family HTH domain